MGALSRFHVDVVVCVDLDAVVDADDGESVRDSVVATAESMTVNLATKTIERLLRRPVSESSANRGRSMAFGSGSKRVAWNRYHRVGFQA